MLISFSLFLAVFISCHVRKAIKFELGIPVVLGQTIEKSLSTDNCQINEYSGSVEWELNDQKAPTQLLSGILTVAILFFAILFVDGSRQLFPHQTSPLLNQLPLFLLYRKLLI